MRGTVIVAAAALLVSPGCTSGGSGSDAGSDRVDPTMGWRGPPRIIEFVPPAAPPGSLIEIRGENFWHDPGEILVQLDTEFVRPTASTATTIDVTVPDHAPGFIPVRVNVWGADSEVASFDVEASPLAPTVASVSTLAGRPGEQVEIWGTNFGVETQVEFDNVEQPRQIVIPSQITFAVPQVAPGSYEIVVTNGSLESDAVSFSVLN